MVKIVGILNITPDSFSDGGLYTETGAAIEQLKNLLEQGADVVDVGAQSTRPGAEEFGWEKEWSRLEGFFKNLGKNNPELIASLSLDTKHWQTAEKFLELGGGVLNDVSGFKDSNMIRVAAKFDCLCVVNHFPGMSIKSVHEQEYGSALAVREDLLNKKIEMVESGIEAERIILDPGIGFGKTMLLNWELLEFAKIIPDGKVMIGFSRKRFIDDKISRSAFGECLKSQGRTWSYQARKSLDKGRFSLEANKVIGALVSETNPSYVRIHEISMIEQ